jgi:glycosyltransferase involved in cell wall biosynthesis
MAEPERSLDVTGSVDSGWLREFEAEHQRPLRVLHIGNIANNAYINAKIQRQSGIEADVCCYDYFHVMGSPEWEDADFSGEIGDQFFPDWWAVDLHGFQRPAWFAQGRLSTCQRYLLALRRGEERKRRRLWRLLRLEVWLRCRSTRRARFVAGLVGVVRGTMPQRPTLAARPGAGGGVHDWLRWLGSVAMWTGSALAFALAWSAWRFRVTVIPRVRIASSVVSSVVRTIGRKLVASVRAFVAMFRGASWRTAALMVLPRRLARVARTDEQRALVSKARAEAGEGAAAEGISSNLPRLFQEMFGDAPSVLQPEDYAPFLGRINSWRELLTQYDVVQAYALDTVIPLLAETRAYAAYEHGTLRDLPFEDSARGRLCALSYRAAPVVFVTNSDVLPAARKLGLTRDQTVYLPHAVDSGKLADFGAAHAGLRPPKDEIVIFSPTRHDWTDGDPLWAKGNDRLLRALARLDTERPWRAVLVDWGRHAAESRALATTLGLEGRIEWIEPLRKSELWRRYLTSHVVVDQFLTPAMGSVSFESLALGRRVLTSIDVATITEFFGTPPPLLNAHTVDEIEHALRVVLEDPEDAAGIGERAACWFKAHHSTERILQLELEAYRRLVA